MPGKYKRKLPSAEEGRYRMAVLGILEESEISLTIDQIKLHDFSLTYLTTSKMARILGHLIDMGLVRKSKDKSINRMKYMAVAQMAKQGYDVDIPPDYYMPKPERPWNGVSWEAEDWYKEQKEEKEWHTLD